jgi:hypothetical protein
VRLPDATVPICHARMYTRYSRCDRIAPRSGRGRVMSHLSVPIASRTSAPGVCSVTAGNANGEPGLPRRCPASRSHRSDSGRHSVIADQVARRVVLQRRAARLGSGRSRDAGRTGQWFDLPLLQKPRALK